MKLTERTIETLKAPHEGSRVVYDREGPDRVRGLGLCITYRGTKSWVLDFSDAEGKRRRAVLFDEGTGKSGWPDLTVQQARALAKDWQGRIRKDRTNNPIDAPRREREEAKAEREAEARALTFAQVAEQWKATHAQVKKRASSQVSDQSILQRHLLPRFGAMKPADIRRSHILQMRADMKDTPIAFNRALSLLITLLRHFDHSEHHDGRAGLDGHYPWQPAKELKFRERDRHVKVTRDDLDRLYRILEAHPYRDSVNAVKLAVWTGARRGEILGARWGEFDLKHGRWKRPGVRTKSGRDSSIPLNELALALLRQMRGPVERGADEFVFPSDSKQGHLITLKTFWATVRKRAKLPTLRIHDLRHVFASATLEAGGDYEAIRDLLGQQSTRMAQIYAEWSEESKRLALASNAAVSLLAPKTLKARKRASV